MRRKIDQILNYAAPRATRAKRLTLGYEGERKRTEIYIWIVVCVFFFIVILGASILTWVSWMQKGWE